MNFRKICQTSGIALALICTAFSVLFIQAEGTSTVTISNLVYISHSSGSQGTQILGWDPIENETNVATVQYKGGGLTDIWTTLETSLTVTLLDHDGRTRIQFSSLRPLRADDTAFKFRVKVSLDDGSETPWAYVDEPYP